ncbi:MAG: hypothetical protein ACOCQR_00140 [bacterium]
MFNFIKNLVLKGKYILINNKKGQGMVMYALLLLLIAVLAFGALQAYDVSLTNLWESSTTRLVEDGFSSH